MAQKKIDWIIVICNILILVGVSLLVFGKFLCVYEVDYIDHTNGTHEKRIITDVPECYTIIGMFRAKKMYDERMIHRLTQNM